MEKKKEITISPPVALADSVLIGVIETLWVCHTSRKQVLVNWKKQPVAVIIVSQKFTKAYSADGEEISINELKQMAPEIESYVSFENY